MVKFFFLLVISLSLFLLPWGAEVMTKEYRVDQLVINPLMGKVAEDCECKYDMNPIGVGISMPGGIVKRLGLEFQIRKPLSREAARAILIACSSELLSRINSSKEMRPYLKNFPFTINNVGIGIYIQNHDGNSVYDPGICVASISDGKLTYDTRDKNNRYVYKSTITESYEEALQAMSTNGECENLQKQGIK